MLAHRYSSYNHNYIFYILIYFFVIYISIVCNIKGVESADYVF